MKTTFCWVVIGLWSLAAAAANHKDIKLEVQRRGPGGDRVMERIKLDPARTAVVVIDMWDRHWCKTYTARVANMVPRMNQTLAVARILRMQVVWAPSDVLAFYKDVPQRKAMAAIPTHQEPKTITFNPAAPPEGLDCCECGPERPCKSAGVWTRQNAGLEILDDDLIGDCNNAQELFNLCAERHIDTLIYLGVASNMCVPGRAFGMLNARRHGLNVIFMRDLVEAITANGLNPATKQSDWNFTPAKGSARTEHYLEQEVAPSLQSRQLLAAAGMGPAAQDRRPHIVFVLADDEYKSEQTLPAFAREHLAKKFRCTFCYAKGNDATNRNEVAGLEALYDADLLVLSMRRRALPVPQMDFLERYIRAGKPLVALRVSIVPFQVDPKQRSDGNVIWRDFDQEVLGCHYRGYNPKARETGTDVWAVTEARAHPILAGLAKARFHSSMWIYRQNPLTPSTTVLLQGRWSEQDPEEPVAWTNSYEGGRVFYTTLGHWDDFKNGSFNRLLKNAIVWALDR
ncbi:MAG: isochorismatase family protein [Verrucomicrobia bacterium]|nr:isochorismatase family protein [Verrucomicrobiota bacterium]